MTQNVLLFSGLFLIVFSFFINNLGHHKKAILILSLGGFCIFLYSALLDPYLNLWDERFHALVAKNLIKHPLMPTLFDDPIIPMAYDRWDRVVIWLHKQPLFLWLIALSYKIFGVNEFTLRFPSVIMATLLIPMVCRTGKLLVNENTGYLSGLLTATSFYIFNLVSGRQELEHNDVAFLFFVSGSIWAWIEYQNSGTRKWIVFIGLFSGFSILTKWLPGLLVYLGWTASILIQIVQYGKYGKDRIRNILPEVSNFLMSLIITSLIVIPWQILIFKWYPSEASQVYKYNALHFSRVLEGHGGSFWFYFQHLNLLYGNILLFLVPVGLFTLIWKVQKLPLKIGLLIMPLFIYVFFSIAKTKMNSYPFIAAIFIFSGIASFLDAVESRVQAVSNNRKIIRLLFPVFFLMIIYLNIQVKKTDIAVASMQSHNKAIFQSLARKLPRNTVIVNVRGRHYIECMFYTGLSSYNFIPDYSQYIAIKKKGKKVAIFNPVTGKIPGYLLQDPDVLIIPDEIQSYE